MTHYKLIFPEHRSGPMKVVEFAAADAASALIYAHREAPERSAELWCDGRKLCVIRRSRVQDDNLWHIMAATA